MRVLFVNDTPRNGGPGRSLYTILKFLPTARVHRTVLLPREGVISDLYREHGVADEILTLPDLVENPVEPWSRAMLREDYDAPAPLRWLRLVGNLGRATRGVLALSKLARTGRYDLIYCNGTNANFFGGIAAALSGVPALWHVRYTHIPPALRPVHDTLAQSGDVTAIVCVSEAAAALFPRAGRKVRVVHNALDVDEFGSGVEPCLRRELGFPEDAIVFGSQGRILPRKGYLEMIEAARLALASMDPALSQRCRFVVLGDTPEDLRPDHLAECRARVNELGLEQNVHFLGFRGDVRPYVADYDVGIVPSVYPDPLPRAVIECMAFGKPVLAFDVGGVAEMLGSAEAPVGRLLCGDPPDVAGLAAAIGEYAGDAGLRREQGARARQHIESRYDARAHAAQIMAIIDQAARA